MPFARAARSTAPLVARRVATLAWTAGAARRWPSAIFRLGDAAGCSPPQRRRAPPGGRTEARRPRRGGPAVRAARRPFHAARRDSRASRRSVLAEALLVWQSASWVKWPLLLASAVTLVVPAVAAQVSIAVFLLLLGPVIAEAAARERLAGTAATVFAQPGVPRSAVRWKVAAVAAFVAVVGAPVLLRSLGRGPAHGLAMLLALLFVATAAAGLGWLSGGGKLFLGLFTALWYIAVQRDSPLDFSGAFASRPNLALCAGFAAAGLAAALAAALLERARAARGHAVG